MTHKLLLADDSVTIQRVVELTFSGENVQVVAVGDGEQAIARIPVELPDIVLADIGMPKRSGYDVAAFVKGRSDLSHIPVLLLAGAFEPVDEARARQVHSDGVLVKPFEPQQVISRVKDLIERSPRAGNGGKASAIGAPVTSGVDAASLESRDRRAESKLDDYFERLDAAFAQLGNQTDTPPHPSARDDSDRREVPTLDQVLGGRTASRSEPPPPLSSAVPGERIASEPLYDAARPASAAATSEPPERRDGRNLVADMFEALFAMEQGEPVAPAEPTPAPRTPAPVVSESLVDEVTRRVLERLAPDAAHELVAQIVSEVAERLIREEISRIKAAAATARI